MMFLLKMSWTEKCPNLRHYSRSSGKWQDLIFCFSSFFSENRTVGEGGRFRASKGHRPARITYKFPPAAGRPLSRVEGASTRAQSQQFPCQVGGRFRSSKAAQSRRGKTWICFPPDPLCSFAAVRAAATRGGSGCSGFLEFPLPAEGIPRKVAASVLCNLSGSRRELRERSGYRRGCKKPPAVREAVIYGGFYFSRASEATRRSAFSCSAVALSAALVLTYSLILGSVPEGRTQTQLPFSSSK